MVVPMRTRKSKRGYLLIEALFAIFFIFMAAMIVTATLPVSNVSRYEAQLQDKAMDLAQKQVEAIRTLGFANATAGQLASNGLIDNTTEVANNTFTFTNVDSANLDNPATVLPNGAGTVTVNSLSSDFTQLIVTVTWTNQGTPETYSVGTLLAQL